MVELTGVIAFENYLARFNRGFAIEPSGFSKGAVCPVPDHQLERMRAASERSA